MGAEGEGRTPGRTLERAETETQARCSEYWEAIFISIPLLGWWEASQKSLERDSRKKSNKSTMASTEP